MAVCKDCKSKIVFKKVDGVLSIQNEDGSSHFDVCKQKKWEMIVSEGAPFQEVKGSGYVWRGGRYYAHMIGPTTTGENFRESGCRNCVPPWEECCGAK